MAWRPIPTTRTQPRPARRKRSAPGRKWTPPCSTPNSMSTSTRCRTRGDPPRVGGALTMGPFPDEQVKLVRSLVAAIPPGKACAYGDTASVAGLSIPRIVGWIRRTDSSHLPWHRVISASGRPARHLRTRQLELLRAEGVLSVDGRVSLREVRYEFPSGP